MTRSVFVLCVLLLASCTTRQTAPAVYRLVNTGPAPVLVPPGIRDPALNVRTFDFAMAKRAPAGCRVQDEVFRVDPHRASLRITVDRSKLVAHPAPWLADWADAMEQRGCIATGKSAVLAEQVVESVPLKPSDAYRLLHLATYDFVDLLPGYRLKLVSPILKEGASSTASALATESVSGNDNKLSVTLKTSSDFLGYEISWYEVRPDGKLGFAAAESHIGKEVTATAAPRVNHFVYPATAAYYRLFYLTRISQADHNTAVLGAPTRAELVQQTPLFTRDPDACEKAPQHSCVLLSKEIGVTVYLTVTTNGTPRAVSVNSTVADALRDAGIPRPATVLASLAIRRLYKGTLVAVEFDRSKPDILSLKLTGNEDLRW